MSLKTCITKSKPKVTFVIPSIRNDYLIEAINSVLYQSLADWELLFFNNNPARNIKFKDKRIIIINTKGSRFTVCMNIAHTMAKSNIIIPMSDDDISMPDRAYITYNLIEKGADLVFGSYFAIDRKSRILYFYCCKKFDPEYHKTVGNGVPSCGLGYRLDSAPSWREEINIFGDYTFIWDSYLKKLKFKLTATPLSFYRLWSNSESQKNHIKLKEETKIIRKLYNEPTMRANRKWQNLKEVIDTKELPYAIC